MHSVVVEMFTAKTFLKDLFHLIELLMRKCFKHKMFVKTFLCVSSPVS